MRGEERMTDLVSREAQMSIAASSMFPGFRFCPTDEELISYYLRKKLDGHEESVHVISEVEICKYEPWDLPAKSFIQSDNEWFFFSPRGRKYPNGSQSKRATECGYWKATGKERNVKSGSNVIGTKRTLVFHLGRAPKGERTEWIMHEYCVNDKSQDSLVVCRLKRNADFRQNDASNGASSSQQQAVNSHESNCAVSEAEIDQRGVSEQDKGAGCSSKRSSCSDHSPLVEQIDSASESNQRTANYDPAVTEYSSHQKEVDDEDCYAEILKNDIVKLDDSSLTLQEAHTRPQDHPQTFAFQGTAPRRIRLRVDKSRRSVSPALGFPTSKRPSQSTNLFGTLTNRVLICVLFVLTLIALYLSLMGLGSLKPVKSWERFGSVCKL
ncbi:NAC domain-containing protein 40-like [Neltuma alba]|uniref:NAC domain-containing protein 40-like n=1 Tax=Neltuma alba TaxID=207710 RepID=UPI0010A432E4|nr:NAC domain-containing protein 40-like [Prosopis alba]